LFRKAISVVLQMLLFLAAFALGSFLPALAILPMWRITAGQTHYFVLDGLVCMLALYVVVIAIEAARRRLGQSAGLTTLALVLALALGLAMKLGFMDRLPGY